MGTKHKLKTLKQELNQKVKENNNNFIAKSVVKKSQELDKEILNYYKNKKII